MNGGDTKAQFTLEISVFKDKDYLLPYGIKEFPLRVSLSKPLYVQVKCAKARKRSWFEPRLGDIALCSWARHFTVTMPLSTKVFM